MTRGKTITGSWKRGYYVCGTVIKLSFTDLVLFLPYKLNGGNWLEVNLCERNKVMKNKRGRKESAGHTLANAAAEGWGSWNSAEATPSQTQHGWDSGIQQQASTPVGTATAPIGAPFVPVGTDYRHRGRPSVYPQHFEGASYYAHVGPPGGDLHPHAPIHRQQRAIHEPHRQLDR